MKLTKNIILIILSLCIMGLNGLFNSIPVKAAESKALYIALGDSITSGYGLENYVNNNSKNKYSPLNSVTKLGKRLGMNTVNYGVEGIDSTVFYNSISKPITKEQKSAVEQIKAAKLITLSIGGNNVFIPLLNSINSKIGDGKNIFNASSADIQTAVIALLFNKNDYNALLDNISKGAEVFTGNNKLHKTGDFKNIITTIKTMNPKAKVVVQTIYNPYDFLPDYVDNAIKSMNTEIIKFSDNGKYYKVADIYSAFSKAPEGIQLTNSDAGSFDPHPSKKGHEVIYTLMSFAAENKLPFPVKANVIHGKAETTVAAGEMKVKIIPAKGYKLPKTILLTINKSAKYTLNLLNGMAAVPVADVTGEITITAVCSK